MVSFHFEEENITLEVLRNRVLKLQNVFLACMVAVVVLIVSANLAAIYLHKSEDHGQLIVTKEFKNVTYMDWSNLSSLTHKAVKPYLGSWYDFFAPDGSFAAYSEQDLDEFLSFAKHYPWAPYSLEDHDCDDFAMELVGLERLWFARKGAAPFGSSFGVIVGDLRNKDDDPLSPRGHAMNVVMLHDLR